MKAVNDYVIVDIIKDGPKKVGGLILTDETDETNRYKKANVISVGNSVPVIKKFKAAVSQAQENRKKVQSIPDLPKL